MDAAKQGGGDLSRFAALLREQPEALTATPMPDAAPASGPSPERC